MAEQRRNTRTPRTAAKAKPVDEYGHLIIDYSLFDVTDTWYRLNNKQYYIGFADAAVCGFNHEVTKSCTRFVNTGGVEKNELRLLLRKNTGDLRSGRLGLRRYDGYVFAEQLIEKRGFSDVRSADQRCKEILFHF